MIVSPSLLRFGWRPSSLRFLSSKRAVVLIYHGVPRRGDGRRSVDAAVLESHIVLLKARFDVIDYRSLDIQRRRGHRIRVVITFDDGYKNNADVAAPILKKHNVPAIFFVSSRHSVEGKYLWFTHVNVLERCFRGRILNFQGRRLDMSHAARRTSIETLTRLLFELQPHPSAMYEAIESELPGLDELMTRSQIDDWCAGMTPQQARELARDPLFTIGGHTCDHPLVSRCERGEALRQIRDNLAWIEQQTEQKCDLFAYPGGDYNLAVLNQCESAGVKHAFAERPRLNRKPALEIPRIGIYGCSDEILGFKVQWGRLLRKARIAVG